MHTRYSPKYSVLDGNASNWTGPSSSLSQASQPLLLSTREGSKFPFPVLARQTPGLPPLVYQARGIAADRIKNKMRW